MTAHATSQVLHMMDEGQHADDDMQKHDMVQIHAACCQSIKAAWSLQHAASSGRIMIAAAVKLEWCET